MAGKHNDRLILNQELDGASEPARYFAYAKAYLQASRDVCERMINDEDYSKWPNAAIAMFLAAHAVELLLKGAILSRDKSQTLGKTHDLRKLRGIYDRLFPEPEFSLIGFFQRETEYLGYSEEEVAKRRKQDRPPIFSILNRYPIETPGKEWKGIHGFMPGAFLGELRTAFEDFNRIEEALNRI